MKIICLMFFCSLNTVGALQVTEIFWNGRPEIRSEERFVEIFNDGATPIDLNALTISVPKSDTATVEIGVEKGDFGIRQNDIVTDSMVLPPGGFAVILTEDFSKYARLLSFSPGTMVLKPKTKTFSGWSWTGRTGLISLRTNGVLLFSCANYEHPSAENVPAGSSVSFLGGKYAVSGLSPGVNEEGALYSDSYFIREGGAVNVFLSDKNETNESAELTVTIGLGTPIPFRLNRLSDRLWKGHFTASGLVHGDDVRFQRGKKSLLVRYLEKRPLSVNYGKVLVNELVTDPRTDYSGGGWNGSDGGGTIDNTDEWVELVNVSDGAISASNYYLLYRSDYGESVKKLGIRFNPCFGKKSEMISNYNYIVFSPESGLANNASIGLYEGYPWLNGRLVDELDYGKGCGPGPDPWYYAPEGCSAGTGDEAIVRSPNAVYDKKYRDVFRKGSASFGRSNSDGCPLLWARNVTGIYSNVVYFLKTDDRSPLREVSIWNHADRETLVLTNYGIYFMGNIRIANSGGAEKDGILNVKNGVMNLVSFFDPDLGKEVTTRFIWAEEGWSLPENSPGLSKAVLYPNPVDSGKKTAIVFANLPDNAQVTVIDPFGNLIARLINEKGNGLITWDTQLRKGIYLAVIRAGSLVSSKKLLVR